MTSPIPPSKEEIEVAKERLESCMTCTWSPFAFPYTEIRTILSVLSSAEKDTARLDLAQKLLIGADFAWGDPDNPSAIVAIAMPIGTRIGTDLRAFLDASLALIRPASTSTDSEVGNDG